MSTRDKHQLEMPRAVLQPPAQGAPASDHLVRVASSLDALLGDARPSAETTAAAAQRLHARQAKAAHTSGVEGERAWVEVHHNRALYDLKIAARIWHTGEPSVPHVVRGQIAHDRRGRVLKASVGLAPPDYVGIFTSGVGFVAEVKRRTGRLCRDRHAPDGTENREGIEAHQARDLAVLSTTQAPALVVVTFVRARKGGDVELRCAAPWSVVSARWRSPAGGALSVGPEDLEDYRVTGDCYLTRFVR